jgi:hypothetical protein
MSTSRDLNLNSKRSLNPVDCTNESQAPDGVYIDCKIHPNFCDEIQPLSSNRDYAPHRASQNIITNIRKRFIATPRDLDNSYNYYNKSNRKNFKNKDYQVSPYREKTEKSANQYSYR